MLNSSFSPADLAAVTNSNSNDTFGGNGGWWFLLIILFAMFGGGYGNFGGLGNGQIVYGDTPATTTEVNAAVNQQSTYTKLNDIQSAITSTGYENAQLTNNGVNTINTTLNSGFDGVTASINNLGYQMGQGFCELKTQMLQDKYDDTRYQLEQANTAVANAVQTQNLLNAMGSWYSRPSVSPCSAYGGCGCNSGITIA